MAVLLLLLLLLTLLLLLLREGGCKWGGGRGVVVREAGGTDSKRSWSIFFCLRSRWTEGCEVGLSAGCRQQTPISIHPEQLPCSEPSLPFCREWSSLLFSSLCLLLFFVRDPWWNCRGGFIALDWGLLGRCASPGTALGGKVCTRTHAHIYM